MSGGAFNFGHTDPRAPAPGVYLIVANRDADREAIIAGLPRGAKIHLATGEDYASLPQRVVAIGPNILIGACEAPDAALLEAFGQIASATPLPVILFTEKDPGQMAQRALAVGVSAYIVNGLSASRIARERFRMTEALHLELKKSREELASRKVIERAKGLLMERRGLSEQAAYEAMRRLAMTKARPMREIAELILSVSDILP